MDENKNEKKNNNDEQFSDYEELLNGFSSKAPADDSDVGGHDSEDGFVLSELLDGVEAQDDPKEASGGSFDSINLDELGELNFDDITFDDDDGESGASEDSSKTTSGKFEIDIDDDNTDYASILSELENSGAKSPSETEQVLEELDTESIGDEKPEEDAEEGIELDLNGFMSEEQEEPQDVLEEESEISQPDENLLEDIFSDTVDEPEAEQSIPELDIEVPDEEETAEKTIIDITSDEPEAADTAEEITGEYDVVPSDETTGELETEAVIAEEEPPEPVFDGDLDYTSLIDETEQDETVAADAELAEETYSEDTAEYTALDEELEDTGKLSPDVSYTSYIAADDAASIEEEPVADFSDFDEAEDETTGEIEITADHDVADENTESISYADFIGDQDGTSMDSEDEDVLDFSGSTDEPEEGSGESFEHLAQEDFSLDDADFDLGLDDTDLAADTSEHDAVAEDGIVVSGGDLDEDVSSDDDFLGISEITEEADDSFLGVADVKQEKLPEIMLEGIDMDTVEQTAAVTRAELFIAQGNRDEAATIYEQIVSENGVSPFVARRIRELGLDISVTEQEAEELAGE